MSEKSEVQEAGAESAQSSDFKLDMKYLVKALVKYHASDLHLRVGRPPLFRVNGKLIVAKMPVLTSNEAEKIICGILSPKQLSELENNKQIDLSFKVDELGRFRCNVFYQRNTIAAAVRMIPYAVPKIGELGLPPVLKELCMRLKGLILVTGPTGSGKSTTLTAMTQYINETSHVHILALEDPIEFVYRDIKATITQREIGSDALSMSAALIAGLRQDPDVILLGEARDSATIEAALTAAETGHLVMTTLHTNDAKSSIDRILDVCRGSNQNQVRHQLASTLAAVISQQLVLRADGKGLVPACEVMIKSPAIEECIKKNESNRLQEFISNSNNYYHMQSMNQSLEQLVRSNTVTLDEALKHSSNPDDLRLIFSGLNREEGYNPPSS